MVVKFYLQRRWWLLLVSSMLLFELTALYFQYRLELDPCVLCVFQRTAVMGVLVAGLVGVINPLNRWLRFTAYSIWGACSIWGAYTASKHAGLQLGFIEQSITCEYTAPTWFMLDKWVPWMFEPTSIYCDEIKWSFFGFSMPQVMLAIFVLLLLTLLYICVIEIRDGLKKTGMSV
ncbi:MAG: disulfide bond formation protein B [Gammaproteobacteria bacterium]|nr:disulfide bond formation protein B [Gammaproteobacteria bacterium]